MAAAEFGRGLALSGLDKTGPSIVAFTAAAARLDPTDPAAPGFRPTRCSSVDRTAEAVAAAQRGRHARPALRGRVPAVRHRPAGAAATRPAGVKALRRGLVLLEEPERADQLIAQHLDPTDP